MENELVRGLAGPEITACKEAALSDAWLKVQSHKS